MEVISVFILDVRQSVDKKHLINKLMINTNIFKFKSMSNAYLDRIQITQYLTSKMV